MRIAQIAPLYESVPPKLYGGTERVVSYLTEELVEQGHDVTLFASGDSVTSARLFAGVPTAIRLNPKACDMLAPHFFMMESVFKMADRFDVLHFHIDYMHFPTSRRIGEKSLTTLHGRLDIPDIFPLFREFSEMPLISISDSQRAPMPDCNWVGTVHHGLPKNLYQGNFEKGKYLAFIGRISPEKRVDRAIEIARRVGMKLKIAAKVDKVDREYYEQKILPLIKDKNDVEFIGEIGEFDKNEFLGNAHALLFPIDWPEPFGLVMIEANACGTPVIAFRRGSVSEVIEDGVNGIIVDSVDEAVANFDKIGRINRQSCREFFEIRYSARRMALDYVQLYKRIAELGPKTDAYRGTIQKRDHSIRGPVLRSRDLRIS